MAKYSFKFEGSVSELKCLLKGFPGYLNVRVSSVAEPELKAINPSSEHAYTSEDVVLKPELKEAK
jgi:hypothetical protein